MSYLFKSLHLSGVYLKRALLKPEELKGAGAFLKEQGAVHRGPKTNGAEFSSSPKTSCRAGIYTMEPSQQEMGMVPF